MVLIENYCARTGDQILDQIGTSVTNEVENIKFTFRQFAFTEIIDGGEFSLVLMVVPSVLRTMYQGPQIQKKYNSELILNFDIKCSLRLGSFPGCPPTSRSLAAHQSRQVVASSNFDWSASWVIETEISADQAAKLTQDGIIFNEVIMDQPLDQPVVDRNRTGNGAWNILETKIFLTFILISSLF